MIKQFKKPDRYTIGNRVFSLLLELLVEITKAEYQQPTQKRNVLISLSPTLDTVKILVRLSKSLGILEMRHYITIEEQLNTIGRDIGAWIHILPHNEPPRTRV